MTCFQKVRSHCLEIPRAISYIVILGMRWIAHLAFVRRVNRCARAIARLLLTGLYMLRTLYRSAQKTTLCTHDPLQ